MSKRRSGVHTTRRTDMVQAQRRMDELFRALIENAPDIIMILDAEGIIHYACPSVGQVLGYKPHELIGTDIAELLRPDDLSEPLESYAAMKVGVRSGTPETCQIREERLRHKDGSWRILEGIAKVLDTLPGAGVVIYSRDITERKRAEQGLHESEERYRSLVEAMPDVIYTVSAEDGSITSLNPAFETLTGWSRAEWLGKPFMGILHPDDLPVAVKTFRKASRGETQPPSECRILAKSGEYLVGEFTFTPHVKEGRVVGELGIARDITARKRAEKALKKSTQLLNDVGEMAKVGGWELDLSTKEVSWTEEVCRIHGVEQECKPTLEEAMNFYAPESRPALEEALKKTAETGEPYDLESLFIPSGSKDKIWVRSLGRAVYSHGRIVKLAGTFQNIDKYKRAEEALRQSKENFEALAESASEGILIGTGEEGRHVYANSRAVEITGYPIEELLKTCMGDIVHPDELPKLAERYKKRLVGLEVPNHYETALLNKDGAMVPIEISPSRTIWQNQLANMVIFRDITERKRAGEAVRLANAYNRSLIEASLDPLVTIAPDGKITDVNNTTEKVTGLSRQQLIGTDFSNYFADSGKARAGYEQVFREGLVQDYELEIRHRDGHVTPVLYNASVYRDEAGDVIGVFAAARDISERKRAEEALRESEARFRAIFENAALGIALVDVHGHPVESNPALQKMLGYNKIELADVAFTEFTHAEDAGADWDLFIELVEGKRDRYLMEKRFLRRDGQVVWGQLNVSLVRNEKGEFKYSIGMVEDISERKRTEEALRQLSGRLLRLQDEERRRIARQLHETIAQGLAGLAVNLSIVKTSATDLSPRASACLSESLELAEQCSREVRTISYLLHPPLVDEAGLAPALRWYTAGVARRSGIEAHVNVSPEFGRLPSDLELTLYRIVQEALTNIHRHSGSKTARISLDRRPEEIVLTVADEGHGFPADVMGITGPESVNIGVGIPGMRERLRQLGGRLHIQSGSQGTTLTAYLPLSEVAHGETTHPIGR